MNLDSCVGCHAFPAPGGSSPPVNPQFLLWQKSLDHNTNKLPSFITENGPTREARFKKIRYAEDPKNAGPDGGVHDLFTIAGMKGAEGYKLEQPEFEEEWRHNNVIFRIPTPVFGGGLIEQIPDTAIIDNLNKEADRDRKKAMGIGSKLNIVMSGNTRTGQPNKTGNDGTIARFGWKAQNKSLLIFSGEAYNVEMGISNELFQTEREEKEKCQFKPTPNDATDPAKKDLDILSDIEKFASYMRLLTPPEPSSDTPGGSASIIRGTTLFSQTGCALCHAPVLKTGKSTIPQLSEKVANLYSDLAVHHMGPRLDDGVAQGQAEHDEFRTAPLWGLGKRIFFLHDGRTSDLVKAIEEHRSGPNADTVASEANSVVDRYDNLSETDKQDLLNFLRSL